MPADENPRYLRKLEAIITALEAENQRLTEQGQETLLRGSIAESISGMESPDDILAYTLKQIALIKDLPYCAFCELDDQKTLLRYSFATFQEENSIGGQINLSRDLIDTLEAGPLLLSEENLVK